MRMGKLNRLIKDSLGGSMFVVKSRSGEVFAEFDRGLEAMEHADMLKAYDKNGTYRVYKGTVIFYEA